MRWRDRHGLQPPAVFARVLLARWPGTAPCTLDDLVCVVSANPPTPKAREPSRVKTWVRSLVAAGLADDLGVTDGINRYRLSSKGHGLQAKLKGIIA